MLNTTFSIFKNATSTEPKEAMLISLAHAIHAGRWKDDIESLRAVGDTEYSERKKALPAVTFSGTFSERKIDGLLAYSGLVVLDIDHLTEDNIFALKLDLMKDEYAAFCFVSPSGKGLKVVYRVSTDKENHLAAFLHLQDYFQKKYLVAVDPSGKDLSRLCFVSYDPESLFNEEAKVFEVDLIYGQVKTYTSPENFANYKPEKDYTKIFQLAVKWVEGGATPIVYAQGSRNRYIHALSCALNRVGMPIGESVKLLQQTYDLEPKEIQQCCRNAYFKHASEHGKVEVKDISVGVYKAPAYIQNYTDDYVGNDIMVKTSMLFSKGVPMDEIADIIGKMTKYYDSVGLIDYDRSTLGAMMNRAIQMLNEKVAEQSSELSLKYESVAEVLRKLVKQDFTQGIVPTYLSALDLAMDGGLKPKSFYGIVGVGGTFKSILMQYMCYANAANGVPVLYINSEMSDFQFADRLFYMVFAHSLSYKMAKGEVTEENIEGYIESMMKELDDNFFVFNGKDSDEETIAATLDNIKAKTGKTVRLIGIDGISQMNAKGKEEIHAAIMNTGVAKELAKNCNGGEGAVVLGLMHVSGEQVFAKVRRDNSPFCRGGGKTIANMDGVFSCSLLIDPETDSLENEEEIIFIPNKFYLRLVDKRTRTGTVSSIINVNDKNLHLSVEDCAAHEYERKINKKQRG